jgi:hypothetical protein
VAMRMTTGRLSLSTTGRARMPFSVKVAICMLSPPKLSVFMIALTKRNQIRTRCLQAI